jgi:hypothetical protein
MAASLWAAIFVWWLFWWLLVFASAFDYFGRVVERFRFKCCHLKTVRGAIFFHPIDKDLSLGTPERKMPLGPEVSVMSRIETAVEPTLDTRKLQC